MTILDMLVGGRARHEPVHNVKRLDLLSNTPSQIYYTTRITFGTADGLSATNSLNTLTTDVRSDPASAYTTITQTYAEVIQQPGVTLTSTYASAVAITDSAQYSSLRASESSASAAAARTTTTTSTAPARTSSTAANSSSSTGLGSLIPAIVIPVVVVLVASLGLFWFIMRRRHQRQLEEEPEFVMATKPEKAVARGNSNASRTSSTRELVPMSKLEKEVAVSSTEFRKSPNEFSLPKYSAADIGVARPMTPSDKAGANSNPFAKDNTPAVPNFSSVRPGTAGRTRPSQDFNSRNPYQKTQRSQDSSDDQPRGRVAVQGSRGPPRRGESPFMAGSRGVAPRSHRPSDNGSRSRQRSPAERQPSPLNTQVNTSNRPLTSKPLNPPTPTGAFNGASPISQFSPIIKESSSNLENSTKLSSNAGYSNHIDKTLLPLPARQSKAESLPSPELPPPLTREDMPLRLFANGRNSPAGSSSLYQSPTIGAGGTSQAYLNQGIQNNQSSERGFDHRLSIISKISSDDDYVDMEVDNKSDVSSLDERDKWEIESDRLDSSSRLATGYGSAGMSPVEGPSSRDLPSGSGLRPGNSKTNANSNLRDRDSEGPFVLSRY